MLPIRTMPAICDRGATNVLPPLSRLKRAVRRHRTTARAFNARVLRRLAAASRRRVQVIAFYAGRPHSTPLRSLVHVFDRRAASTVDRASVLLEVSGRASPLRALRTSSFSRAGTHKSRSMSASLRKRRQLIEEANDARCQSRHRPISFDDLIGGREQPRRNR
jgi:hypothetical protein